MTTSSLQPRNTCDGALGRGSRGSGRAARHGLRICGVLTGLALLVLSLPACTPFPRKDSVDNQDQAPPDLSLMGSDPTLIDSTMSSALNNENGIAEPGESIQVGAFLSWNGSTESTLSFTAAPAGGDDSCVAMAQAQVPAATVAGTSSARILTVGPVIVRLKPQPCPAGLATFELTATVVETDETYTMEVEFPVMDRDSMVTLEAVTIEDGAMGDGALSPGETAFLSVAVRNEGTSMLRGVGVTLDGPSGCLSAVSTGGNGRLVSVGDVFAGTVGTSGGTSLSVTIAPTCSAGDDLMLTIIAEDASGDRFRLPFTTQLK